VGHVPAHDGDFRPERGAKSRNSGQPCGPDLRPCAQADTKRRRESDGEWERSRSHKRKKKDEKKHKKKKHRRKDSKHKKKKKNKKKKRHKRAYVPTARALRTCDAFGLFIATLRKRSAFPMQALEKWCRYLQMHRTQPSPDGACNRHSSTSSSLSSSSSSSLSSSSSSVGVDALKILLGKALGPTTNRRSAAAGGRRGVHAGAKVILPSCLLCMVDH
jgi:hypothetical protein